MAQYSPQVNFGDSGSLYFEGNGYQRARGDEGPLGEARKTPLCDPPYGYDASMYDNGARTNAYSARKGANLKSKPSFYSRCGYASAPTSRASRTPRPRIIISERREVKQADNVQRIDSRESSKIGDSRSEKGTWSSTRQPSFALGRSSVQNTPPPVDQDGHILANITSLDRFDIANLIDKGTFGTVFKAWDNKWQHYIALKVVRRVPVYVQDAEYEVAVLDKLAAFDRSGRFCVKLFKYFHYHGHLCIVTEMLGNSLYHALKKMRHEGRAPRMSVIWQIARQLCEALAFLRTIRLIHTDLKTENILLGTEAMTLDDAAVSVKLIDFGGATWETDHHSELIQTRHYRAPEVVLGLSWNFPCDMWSVGCILLELYEGQLTFNTHDTLQHLAMIQRVAGRIPCHMVRRIPSGNSVAEMFDGGQRLNWPMMAQSQAQREAVMRVWPLSDRILPEHRDFRDLISRMLEIDPMLRITPEEALQHPFFYEIRDYHPDSFFSNRI